MRRRVGLEDRVEAQRRLLLCAGGVPACERLSVVIVQAIRPGQGRRRTDMTLFGLCEEHSRRGLPSVLPEVLAEQGYSEGLVVAWEAAGALFDEMARAGFGISA